MLLLCDAVRSSSSPMLNAILGFRCGMPNGHELTAPSF